MMIVAAADELHPNSVEPCEMPAADELHANSVEPYEMRAADDPHPSSVVHNENDFVPAGKEPVPNPVEQNEEPLTSGAVGRFQDESNVVWSEINSSCWRMDVAAAT